MTHKERQKAKNESNYHLYKGECIRCEQQSNHIDKETDLCFACTQDDLEFEEERNKPEYDVNDKESVFRHEKEQQGWPDDMDEEIWDKHFRFK